MFVLLHGKWRMTGCYNLLYTLLFQTKNLVGDIMKEAAFSLAEANFAAGDFRHVIVV